MWFLYVFANLTKVKFIGNSKYNSNLDWSSSALSFSHPPSLFPFCSFQMGGKSPRYFHPRVFDIKDKRKEKSKATIVASYICECYLANVTSTTSTMAQIHINMDTMLPTMVYHLDKTYYSMLCGFMN